MVEARFPKPADWNEGNIDSPDSLPVNIFNNLEADELGLLIDMIKPELAALSIDDESLRLRLIGDLDQVRLDNAVGVMEAKLILNYLYKTMLEGINRKTREPIARKILELKSNIKEIVSRQKREAAKNANEETE